MLKVASLVHVFSYRGWKEESLRVGQACQCLQRAFQPCDVVGIEIDKDDLLTLQDAQSSTAAPASFTPNLDVQPVQSLQHNLKFSFRITQAVCPSR